VYRTAARRLHPTAEAVSLARYGRGFALLRRREKAAADAPDAWLRAKR
jgi:hypothetical protein